MCRVMFCESTNQKAFKWEGKSKRNGKKFFLDKEIHFRFCVCVCLISCVLPDHHISSSHFHIHVILQCYFMNHSESFAFSSISFPEETNCHAELKLMTCMALVVVFFQRSWLVPFMLATEVAFLPAVSNWIDSPLILSFCALLALEPA